MKERNRFRAFLPPVLIVALCCALLLGGCEKLAPNPNIVKEPSGAARPPEEAASPAAPASPVYSGEELAKAEDALKAASVLTRELDMEEEAGRAVFISLVVGALGAELPEPDTSIPGETWYAPYVKAGYAAGLFPGTCADMSFLPTDGLFMGERAYGEMEAPISRGDASAILSHAVGGEADKYIPPLSDGEAHGEEALTNGEAVVCAWRLLTDGITPPETAEPPALSVEEALKQSGRIVHAGGLIARENGKEVSYTNSAEALANAYHLGNKVVELDFAQTSDGHLAAIHDWLAEISKLITEGEPLPLAEWMQAEIYSSFTPLCLESLAGFMREHPDLYIVTDVKDNNIAAATIIAETCPDLVDRFVIQIYKDSEYKGVSKLGFSHIILTTYNLGRAQKADTKHWVSFAAKNPLVGYTYPNQWREEEGYTEEMKKTGVMLFVHTINDPAEIEACYAEGFTAVYTDNVK